MLTCLYVGAVLSWRPLEESDRTPETDSLSLTLLCNQLDTGIGICNFNIISVGNDWCPIIFFSSPRTSDAFQLNAFVTQVLGRVDCITQDTRNETMTKLLKRLRNLV